MDNGLGINFAPTADNALDSRRASGLEGLPQAIKILSLHMPRLLGARAPVNSALVNPGAGAQGGIDPYVSALSQTLAKLIGGGMPTGMPGMPGQAPGPFGSSSMPQSMPQMPTLPTGPVQTPQTHWQPLPGGTAGPGPARDIPEFPRNRRQGPDNYPGRQY
jgi:hypothetical protein